MKCNDWIELDEALENSPRDLDATYERILDGIRPENHPRVIRILRWLTFSFENLYVEQVEQIFTVRGDEDKPDPDLLFNRRGCLQNGQNSLYEICSSLISITTNSSTTQKRVGLAHASVSDFIRKRSKPESSWVGRIQSDPHGAIARVCLAYLQQFDKSHVFDKALPPLARYAAQYWPDHALRATGGNESLIVQMESLFIKDGASKDIFENWVRVFDPDHPEDSPQLMKTASDIHAPWYYACLLGLDDVVKHHIKTCKDIVDSGRGFAGNGLQAAASRGHISTVRLLLEAGADVDFRITPKGHDALQIACWRGKEMVVELLLQKKAKTNSILPGGYWGYALQAAAYEGHKKIVEMLLDKGADPNAVGGAWDTPLTAASWERHEDIVRLLLNRGAKANTQGPRCGTALQAVSVEGNVQIAALLIDQGRAEVNAIAGGPECNGTALIAAAASGWLEVVELLLRKGADINLQAGPYGTPLIAAVVMGKRKMAEFLVSKGADVHAQAPNARYKDLDMAAEEPLSTETASDARLLRSSIVAWKAKYPRLP